MILNETFDWLNSIFCCSTVYIRGLQNSWKLRCLHRQRNPFLRYVHFSNSLIIHFFNYHSSDAYVITCMRLDTQWKTVHHLYHLTMHKLHEISKSLVSVVSTTRKMVQLHFTCTFTEQFVSIAKHCGEVFRACTWDLPGGKRSKQFYSVFLLLQLFFKVVKLLIYEAHIIELRNEGISFTFIFFTFICSSSLRTRWRQSLNSCASRLDNSKFYYSLHLPLSDLTSWSLRLGLHRSSEDFLSLQF